MIRLYEVEAEKRAGFLFKRTKDGEVYVVGEDAYDAASTPSPVRTSALRRTNRVTSLSRKYGSRTLLRPTT